MTSTEHGPATAVPHAIELLGVAKQYGAATALQGVDLNIEPG